MPAPEKFGKFVLLEEIDSSGLGTELRAAKLGASGFEKIVSLLRLTPSLSSNVEAARSLMDQVKVAAQLQNPNIIKIFGIGKVESSYYISYEFVEGRNLKAVFARCRQEGFPFSVDHGLLIASKVCSALEYAHSRRLEGGSRYFHGLLSPSSILVSYEGEVRVRGFGYWPSRAREAGALGEEESLYLSPEQALGGNGDVRSDVFAVGAILFETVVGSPLLEGGRTRDLAGRLAEAKLQGPSGEDDTLPKPLSEILGRALVEDPGRRYAEIQEMRKAIDTLLFSGDFTPTTFNLAFFMHSLFRDDIDADSKRFKDERESSYAEYLGDEPARAGAPPPVASARPHLGPLGEPALMEGAASEPAPVEEAASERARPEEGPSPAFSRLPGGEGLGSVRDGYNEAILGGDVPELSLREPQVREPSVREPASREAAREAAAGFTFHRQERRGRSSLIVILAVVLAAAAAAYWFLWGPGRRIPEAAAPQVQVPPPPPSPSPEEVAALARVKELEERLAALEAERAAAEARAAEEAKARMEAQAAARGRAADPGAVQRAQDEARRRTQADQERAQLEEIKRLEERKRAEEARLAEQRRLEEQRREEMRREEARRLAAAATPEPPTTTLAAAAPVTTLPAPAVRAGTLVNLTDPGVVAPVVDRAPTPQYPPIALRQRVEGTVELNVLVDEKGGVVDAQVIAGTGGKVGLNEAAIENVRRRRYRPATKEGVPVKVWIPVRIRFTLPR